LGGMTAAILGADRSFIAAMSGNRTAMRQQGMIAMDGVLYAIIERDSTISIIPKEKK